MYPKPVSGEFGIIPNATSLSSKAYLIPSFKVSIKILLFFISWSDAKTINVGSESFLMPLTQLQLLQELYYVQ